MKTLLVVSPFMKNMINKFKVGSTKKQAWLMLESWRHLILGTTLSKFGMSELQYQQIITHDRVLLVHIGEELILSSSQCAMS